MSRVSAGRSAAVAATGKPLALLGFELFQTSEVGDAQEEQLELVLKYMTGAVTSGSGGPTAPTFRPKQPNDTAAGATIEHGNTTKATGGTSVTWARFSWNVRQSLPYVPMSKPPISSPLSTSTRAAKSPRSMRRAASRSRTSGRAR